MELVFWAGLAIVFYTYAGYPVILGLLVKLRKVISKSNPLRYTSDDELPPVTVMIACFNEADILDQKVQNTFQLDYPVNKKRVCFVTDGSTDGSPELLAKYADLEVFHSAERKGKSAAINRVMEFVKTPIVVFCDANTILNKESLKLLVRHYKDPKIGAVAGEKRILKGAADNAAGSGEGAYWKYESLLKKWDSALHTVVGAAGELFSIRTELYEHVPAGVMIEDFRLSMNIARKGFRVLYEPEAIASETGSASVEEERKRKVRISAGGLIEVWHFMPLFNFFKYKWLTFQYVSHRMMRWTIAPACLPVVFIANLVLFLQQKPFYVWLFYAQCAFYLAAFAGSLLKDKKIKPGALFIPYYFVFMNMSLYQGLVRLARGKQTAVWEKAKRA